MMICGFGFAGPAGKLGPTIAILPAAGFAMLAAVLSLLRLLNFVRLPAMRRAAPAPLDERQTEATSK